ncbi:MAG: response regulator transcription factor [Cyclobacteriaceae bacterium]|nr:response regulator transcription factor [Cyclobacteriaceae bacterium]
MKHYNETLRRIVIIEDNDELRSAYDIIIRGLADYIVVGAYASCEEAIKRLSKDNPDLVLMDLSLPGISGMEGISYIKRKMSAVKIIVLTVHDDSENVFNAFCAGAMGYITKDANHNQLIAAINEVFTGGAPMSPKIASMIINSFHRNPKSPLTERETDVLKSLARGVTYDYIAKDLSISKDTVKTHIRHIYEKLHVTNKSEALIKARKDNLV